MFRILCFLVMAAVSAPAASAQNTNYIASAGYSYSNVTVVAPGQIISLFVQGLNVPDAVASKIPWPTSLSGVSVIVPNPPTSVYPMALPILSVSTYPGCVAGPGVLCTTNVVVQFPYEATCIPNGFPNDCTIPGPPPVNIVIQVTGKAGQGFTLAPFGGPHFLNTCDSIFNPPGPICFQVITHADGSLVGYPDNPGVSFAHPSEEITIYAVGLGATPHSKTGQAVSAPDPLGYSVYLTPAVLVGSNLQFGPPIKADWAGLVAGFVGLYQINMRLPASIPADIPPCGSAEGGNLRLFFGNQVSQVFLDTANTAAFTDVCVATN